MKSNKKIPHLLAGSIFLLTLLAYLPALQNDFVDWDDVTYVFNNPYIRSLNSDFFRFAFLRFYFYNWHPLTFISYALDYSIWGLDPLGYHLTNIVLHAINAALVVSLAVKLIEVVKKRTAPAASRSVLSDRATLLAAGMTGLLFGLNPVHVESVAWISERKDLLCLLFFLLSILQYVNYAARVKDEPVLRTGLSCFLSRPYLLSVVFFLLALLCKPMAVTLPVVLLILDWYPFKRILSFGTLRTAFMEKIAFLILSLVSSILTLLAQRAGGAIVSMEDVSFFTRVLVGTRSLIVYLWKMAAPVNLIPYYSYPREVSLLSAEYLSAIVLFIVITMVCAFLAKKQKTWLAVWSYYVVTLVPVIGIVQVGMQSMADRYTYLPSLGPFLAAGLGVAHVSEKMRNAKWWNPGARYVFVAMAIVVMSSMTYLTIQQIAVWKNSLALWNDVIEEQSSESAYAYLHRGIAFDLRGQTGKAREDIEKAVALNPDDYEAFISLGIVYYKLGLQNMAIESLNKSIALKPNFLAYSNRAYLSVFAGQDDLALADFNNAIKLNEDFGMAYLGRANLYFKQKEKTLAIADYQKACNLGFEEGCRALHAMGF